MGQDVEPLLREVSLDAGPGAERGNDRERDRTLGARLTTSTRGRCATRARRLSRLASSEGPSRQRHSAGPEPVENLKIRRPSACIWVYPSSRLPVRRSVQAQRGGTMNEKPKTLGGALLWILVLLVSVAVLMVFFKGRGMDVRTAPSAAHQCRRARVRHGWATG